MKNVVDHLNVFSRIAYVWLKFIVFHGLDYASLVHQQIVINIDIFGS